MNKIKTNVKENEPIKAKISSKLTIVEKIFYFNSVRFKPIKYLIRVPNTNTIKMGNINEYAEFASFKRAALYRIFLMNIWKNKIFDKEGFDNLITDNKIKNKISNRAIPIKKMRRWL